MSVEIGKRWRPGHRVYRDDETGAYSEVNSPLLTDTESKVQQALLVKRRYAGLTEVVWPRSPLRLLTTHLGP